MGKKLLLPVLGVSGFVAIVIFKGGFLLLLLALLPSVVAWFWDHYPDKPVFKTVFSCNLAATLPALYQMISFVVDPPSYPVSSPFHDPQIWMTIYLGAAAGWSLIFLCRVSAKIILTAVYRYRVVTMEAMQKKLAAEWGEDVTGTAKSEN